MCTGHMHHTSIERYILGVYMDLHLKSTYCHVCRHRFATNIQYLSMLPKNHSSFTKIPRSSWVSVELRPGFPEGPTTTARQKDWTVQNSQSKNGSLVDSDVSNVFLKTILLNRLPEKVDSKCQTFLVDHRCFSFPFQFHASQKWDNGWLMRIFKWTWRHFHLAFYPGGSSKLPQKLIMLDHHLHPFFPCFPPENGAFSTSSLFFFFPRADAVILLEPSSKPFMAAVPWKTSQNWPPFFSMPKQNLYMFQHETQLLLQLFLDISSLLFSTEASDWTFFWRLACSGSEEPGPNSRDVPRLSPFDLSRGSRDIQVSVVYTI